MPTASKGSGMRVYNKAEYIDLMQAKRQLELSSRRCVASPPRTVRTPSATRMERLKREAKQAELALVQEVENERMQKSLVKRVHAAEVKKEQAFQEIYADVKGEMGELVSRVDKFLSTKAGSQLQKKNSLYNRWNKSVFQSSQDQVEDKLVQMDAEEIGQGRRKRLDKFLEMDRKKGGLYLDIVMPGEYDPFEWKSSEVKYVNKQYLNPVSKDLYKMQTEALADVYKEGSVPAQLSIRAQHFPPLGKQTLPTNQWAKANTGMDLTKTPPPRSQSVTAQRSSKIKMDQFDFPRGQDALDLMHKETVGIFGKGKKTFANFRPKQTLFDR